MADLGGRGCFRAKNAENQHQICQPGVYRNRKSRFSLRVQNKGQTGDHTVHAKKNGGSVVECLTRDRGFKPHRRHCIVVLEQDTFILA